MNIFITGDVGVGKTHKALELMGESIERFKLNNPFEPTYDRFSLVSCTELIYKSTIAKMKAEVLEQVQRPVFLILDDLGVGTSKFGYDIIYIAVDYRMNKDKTTIVTSNLSLEEIAESVDRRLASRLGSFEQLEMRGEDLRLLNK